MDEQMKQIFDETFGMKESRLKMYAACEAVLAEHERRANDPLAWKPSSAYPGYEQRHNEHGNLETRPIAERRESAAQEGPKQLPCGCYGRCEMIGHATMVAEERKWEDSVARFNEETKAIQQSAAQEPQMEQTTPAEDVVSLAMKAYHSSVSSNPREAMAEAFAVAEPIITAKAREGWVPQSELEKVDETANMLSKALDCKNESVIELQTRVDELEQQLYLLRNANVAARSWQEKAQELKQQLAGTVTLEAVEKAIRDCLTECNDLGAIGISKAVRARLTQQEPTEQEKVETLEEQVRKLREALTDARDALRIAHGIVPCPLYKSAIEVADAALEATK